MIKTGQFPMTAGYMRCLVSCCYACYHTSGDGQGITFVWAFIHLGSTIIRQVHSLNSVITWALNPISTILSVGGWAENLVGSSSSDRSGILVWSAGSGRNLGHRDAWVILPGNSTRVLVLKVPPGGAMVIPCRSELPKLPKSNSDNSIDGQGITLVLVFIYFGNTIV